MENKTFEELKKEYDSHHNIRKSMLREIGDLEDKIKELWLDIKEQDEIVNSIAKKIYMKRFNLSIPQNITLDGEEYLLVDISSLGNPIVKTRLKSGKWSKKSVDYGHIDWNTRKRVAFEL